MDQNPAMKLAVALASLVGIWIAVYWLWEPSSANRPPISFAENPSSATGSPAGTKPPGKAEPRVAPDITSDHTPVLIDQSSSSPAKQPEAGAPSTQPVPASTSTPPREQPTPPKKDTRPAVQPPKFEEYKIQAGDDFQKIAARRYGSAALWTSIARANPFVDPHRLRPGRVILLPVDRTNIQGKPEKSQPVMGEGWKTHKVQSGDTLSGISKQYYGTVALSRRIYEANTDRLKNENDLKLGLELLIPPPPDANKPGGGESSGEERR